ncbi:hypothetical protein DAPPUDRAFT_319423 [Daphnia pulex]|uniref:C1q domain-containing protein n=1 Tax=Daphnia pulex TaxID=6669 RepID=E9GLP2_DAPPU|nr:hypothetical protein DAPPUDRAFT_319423 [Daphnia pulex]|eukprot:EFX79539.1 hypothetical protein DAPPUDRAFT_319423 [Daphnia pulex]
MGTLLSWQLVIVLALFLNGFYSSELESPDRVTDPISTSIDTQRTASTDKPVPTKISSVQHESFCINIYESQEIKNKKKDYYHSPITVLKPDNTVRVTNNKLKIRFETSNVAVKTKVLDRLRGLISQEIMLNQVEVLPYESVQLISKVESPDFTLINKSIPNGDQLNFELLCHTKENCERVRNELHICSIDGVEISKNYEMSGNVTELLIKLQNFLDDKFEEKRHNITEETKDLAAKVKILTDKIQTTETNLTETQNKLKNTEAELKNVNDLTTKLNENLKNIDHKLEAVEENLRKELGVGATSATFDSTKMKQDLGNAIDAVAELTKKLNARTSEIVDIGLMPTSCSDLQRIGHKLNGFFMVKNYRKMETVYCNFYPNNNFIQKSIGYSDVKSKPVYFFVQRSSKFDTINKPIQFQMERGNEGDAFDLKTGKFRAPRPGIYFFSFMGLADFLTSSKVLLGVSLQLNGDSVGMAYVDDVNTTDRKSTVTIQSTLKLEKDDRVWVEITFMESSSLIGNGNPQTYFTGFLLEEELSPTL